MTNDYLIILHIRDHYTNNTSKHWEFSALLKYLLNIEKQESKQLHKHGGVENIRKPK